MNAQHYQFVDRGGETYFAVLDGISFKRNGSRFELAVKFKHLLNDKTHTETRSVETAAEIRGAIEKILKAHEVVELPF